MVMPHGSSDIPSLDAPCIAAFLKYFLECFFLLKFYACFPIHHGNFVDNVVAGRKGLRRCRTGVINHVLKD
jgi:hypothetical protein